MGFELSRKGGTYALDPRPCHVRPSPSFGYVHPTHTQAYMLFLPPRPKAAYTFSWSKASPMAVLRPVLPLRSTARKKRMATHKNTPPRAKNPTCPVIQVTHLSHAGMPGLRVSWKLRVKVPSSCTRKAAHTYGSASLEITACDSCRIKQKAKYRLSAVRRCCTLTPCNSGAQAATLLPCMQVLSHIFHWQDRGGHHATRELVHYQSNQAVGSA